ncbi:MAG: RNA ligase family protein [Planctomycetota bacterium]|nr:RNA ligase family protein [Planctomycetota bacterium]
MFGEWAYARHSIFYRRLPHYFLNSISTTNKRKPSLILNSERRFWTGRVSKPSP